MVRVKGLLTVLEIFRDCYKKFNLPTTQDDFYRLGGNFFDVLNSGLLAILAFGSIAHWDKDEPSLDVRLSKNICAILSGQKGMIDKNDKNVFLKPLGCGGRNRLFKKGATNRYHFSIDKRHVCYTITDLGNRRSF